MVGRTSTITRIILAGGMRIFACLVLLTGGTANLWGDDTPKTSCETISERILEIRTDDLSILSQRQQSNIAYYLAEEARENRKIPTRLSIFNDKLLWNQQLNFSLIFPYGGCPHPHRCAGMAVLPGSDKIRLQRFSYRRNLVIAPNVQLATAANQKNVSASLVLLDNKEHSFLKFYDVYQTPAIDGNGKPHHPDYVRSEYSLIATRRGSLKNTNYLACLQNVFNVRDVMPGSGAR
jgi:hypothetical protein